MTTTNGNHVTIQEVNKHGNPDDGPDRNELTIAPGSVPAGANPFIIAVWVLASGLIICGVVMLNQARDPLASGPGGSGYMPLSLILLNIAPYALLAGTLTAVGLMFWHAAQWHHRRNH